MANLPDIPPSARRLCLILLLSAALILRLGWVLTRPGSLENLPDQLQYLDAARSLAAGEGFSSLDDRFAGRQLAQRTPGYPVFILLCGSNLTAIRIAQAFVDTSTVLAVFLVARRLLDDRRALLAAAVVAINPFLIYFSSLLLTETLYTALFAWSLYLLVNRRAIALASLVGGLAILVRPSGVAMPITLAIAAGLALAPTPGLRRALRDGLVASAVILLTLLPWAYRNHLQLGQWVWLSTNGGITLYDGFQPHATGASDQLFVKKMPETRDMGELQRDDYFRNLAWQQIRQDPGRVVTLGLRKLARTWSPIPLSSEYGGNRLYVLVGLLYSLPLLLLSLWAIFRSRLTWQVRLLLFTPAILISLAHAMSVGSLRYRIPIEPLLAIAAASVICCGGKMIRFGGGLRSA